MSLNLLENLHSVMSISNEHVDLQM